MSTGPERSEWHAAVARLIASADRATTADALADAIGAAVTHEGTCLLAFHDTAPPDVLHHTLEPAGVEHYVDRYLAGPYLLDPLYRLALQADAPSVRRFRDEAPDRFRASEYYRQYCERTHLKDEVDFLNRVEPATTVALVVGRRQRRFGKTDVRRLESIAPIVHAAIEKIWQQSAAASPPVRRDRSLHRRLTECFDNFGDGLLTQREREITQLLLRGYSTKAIARELAIAPGTVMVHKRNLFAKLGITSQMQLFSRFIEALSARG
ncbi:MAG: LuxR C-terminal-related transcriptional regulator [Woeseiaceae bacterium]|nr:LuxR C-terminal-related transcriptional regulator [Woeseiaceae bacterium]